MSKIRKSYIVTTLHVAEKQMNVESKEFELTQLTTTIIGKISDTKAEKYAKERNLIYLGKTEEQVTAEMSLVDFHNYATPILEVAEDSQNETEIA